MRLFFERALLPGGIARNVRVSVAADGRLTKVEANSTAGDDPVIRGLAVPGIYMEIGRASCRERV